jgi:hypothetical protein
MSGWCRRSEFVQEARQQFTDVGLGAQAGYIAIVVLHLRDALYRRWTPSFQNHSGFAKITD